jgi:hypothetical protein
MAITLCDAAKTPLVIYKISIVDQNRFVKEPGFREFRLHAGIFSSKLNAMLPQPFTFFMGIDLSTGPKPVTYAVIDEEEKMFAQGEGDLADALSFAAGIQAPVLAAVTCPARPNNGRMAEESVRSLMDPTPEKGKWRALRQADYELLRQGVTVPQTPSSAEHSLPWMKRGFSLVNWLERLNYQPYPSGDETPRQWMEVQPDAAFWSLLGVNPLPAGTLEGRIQRQLVLEDLHLPVPDAMEFFEEITRYKILKGSLPMKYILPQAEINAWSAAHTAWLAVHRPEQVHAYGDAGEGVIYLPCRGKEAVQAKTIQMR